MKVHFDNNQYPFNIYDNGKSRNLISNKNIINDLIAP